MNEAHRENLVSILKFIAGAQVIEDWEFETLFGDSRDEFREMADRFEGKTYSRDDVEMALSHVSMLILYPGASKSIDSRLRITQSQLESLHQTLKETLASPPEHLE